MIGQQGSRCPLRQLIDVGANDDELWRFIQARQIGDHYGANLVLDTTRPARLKSMPSDPGNEHDAIVNGLTVAALRPVVNVLDVRQLHQFVHDVWHESYINAVADVVQRLALDRACR